MVDSQYDSLSFEMSKVRLESEGTVAKLVQLEQIRTVQVNSVQQCTQKCNLAHHLKVKIENLKEARNKPIIQLLKEFFKSEK